MSDQSPQSEKCSACSGRGTYYGRGYVENGVFKGYSGPCYRCQGKGVQTPKDRNRNRYYDKNVARDFHNNFGR